MSRYFYSVLLLPVVLVLSFPAFAQTVDESILIDQPYTGDLYLAGKTIDVLAEVDGDITVAGQRVTVEGVINQDLNVAGDTVLIRGAVQDDVRAAGRTVTLTGNVFGHMVAAGQSVTIGPEAEVGDYAWLAGETLRISGTVNGAVKAAGRVIVIDGVIRGNVELTGRDLRIGPEGHIHGNLYWRSPNPLDLGSGSRIDGAISKQPFPEGWLEKPGPGIGEVIGDFIFVVLSLGLAASAWLLLAPRFTGRACEVARAEPWKCLGLGLSVLIVTPFVCLILFISVIGLLLGLALLGAYLAFLLAGLLMGINVTADSGLRWYREGSMATKLNLILAVFLAAFLLALSWHIPYLGILIFILVWLLGLGCINLGLVRGGGQAAGTRAS